MIKRLLLVLLASVPFVANASTITITPASQTIGVGASTTVDVSISGLAANQLIGAFQIIVMNDPSIVNPSGVFYYSNLGDADSQLTGSIFTPGSTDAAETSLTDNPTLMTLQATQPFLLFRITYTGVGPGTSLLTLGSGSSLSLADEFGTLLPNPEFIGASITVSGADNPPPPPPSAIPEPSSLVLLSSGVSVVMATVRRRRTA